MSTSNPIDFRDIPLPLLEAVEDLSRATQFDASSTLATLLLHYNAWAGQNALVLDQTESSVSLPMSVIFVIDQPHLPSRLDRIFGDRFISMDGEVRERIRERELNRRHHANCDFSEGDWAKKMAAVRSGVMPTLLRSPPLKALERAMRDCTPDGLLVLEPNSRLLDPSPAPATKRLLSALIAAMDGSARIRDRSPRHPHAGIEHGKATLILYTDTAGFVQAMRRGSSEQRELLGRCIVWRPRLRADPVGNVRLMNGGSFWATADQFFTEVRLGNFGWRPNTVTSMTLLQQAETKFRSIMDRNLTDKQTAWVWWFFDQIWRFAGGISFGVSDPKNDATGCATLATRLTHFIGVNSVQLFEEASAANVATLPTEAHLARILEIIRSQEGPITRRDLVRKMDQQRWAVHEPAARVLLMRGSIRETEAGCYEIAHSPTPSHETSALPG